MWKYVYLTVIYSAAYSKPIEIDEGYLQERFPSKSCSTRHIFHSGNLFYSFADLDTLFRYCLSKSEFSLIELSRSVRKQKHLANSLLPFRAIRDVARVFQKYSRATFPHRRRSASVSLTERIDSITAIERIDEVPERQNESILVQRVRHRRRHRRRRRKRVADATRVFS